MIVSTVISIPFNLIYNGFWFILDFSCFIGQNLVSQILVILDVANRILGLLTKILPVLYKDLVIFFQDVTENISYFIAFIVEQLFNVRDSMIYVSSELINCIMTIGDVFFECIKCLFLCVLAPIAFVKDTLVFFCDRLLLIGNSFWLVVLSIPWGIYYCITKILSLFMYLVYGILVLFGTIVTLILNGMINIFISIYNIPYGAISGLVFTVILLYKFMKKFRTICVVTSLILQIAVLFSKRISSHLYTVCTGYFLKGRNLFGNNEDLYMQHELPQDKLCVICLERLKKVLILPCRHLCLCVYCKVPAQQHIRACPVCMTRIEAMMEIYV